MGDVITLDVANAEEDDWTIPATLEDPYTYAAHDAQKCTARFIGKTLIENLKAALNGRVASMSHYKAYTCVAFTLAEGDPVYLSANNTITLALATTPATAAVIGFVRWVSGTSCLIDYFRQVTGLSGGVINAPVYLQDDGSLGAAPGTVAKIVGQFINTTDAILFASPGLCLIASAGEMVLALTATTALAASQNGATITNEGATGATSGRVVTLPAAAAGLRFRVIIENANGIRVAANTGDKLLLFDQVGATAGYAECTTVGASVELRAINATSWVMIAPSGNWTLST
jgi:hypothetical protein